MSSQTTVITGGAGGLGLVTARHLVQAGMDVVLVGLDKARTAVAAEGLRGLAPAGSDAAPPRAYTADLSQWSQVRDLARDTALARTVYDRTASLLGIQVLHAD